MTTATAASCRPAAAALVAEAIREQRAVWAVGAANLSALDVLTEAMGARYLHDYGPGLSDLARRIDEGA